MFRLEIFAKRTKIEKTNLARISNMVSNFDFTVAPFAATLAAVGLPAAKGGG
jgi:hypothetical protein